MRLSISDSTSSQIYMKKPKSNCMKPRESKDYPDQLQTTQRRMDVNRSAKRFVQK
jgi:hypothetical protein